MCQMWFCLWQPLSEKDKTDLEFACSLGVDWLALSFVQRPEDMIEARELADGPCVTYCKNRKTHGG